jgi:hypothetical protein
MKSFRPRRLLIARIHGAMAGAQIPSMPQSIVAFFRRAAQSGGEEFNACSPWPNEEERRGFTDETQRTQRFAEWDESARGRFLLFWCTTRLAECGGAI